MVSSSSITRRSRITSARYAQQPELQAALNDAASSNFQGLIRVNKTSLRTNSNLENRNLLLSDHSKAESDPRLEIFEQRRGPFAPHGATCRAARSGRRSFTSDPRRARDEARRLVVEAFFEEVLQKIRSRRSD